MRRTCVPLLAVFLLGCPKSSPKAPTDPTADALRAWTLSQLDLRAWRSCSRAALDVDLNLAEVVFPVSAEGSVGTVLLTPEEFAHDPAMICLQMELAHPPGSVPAPGVERSVRFPVSAVHEVPAAGS